MLFADYELWPVSHWHLSQSWKTSNHVDVSKFKPRRNYLFRDLRGYPHIILTSPHSHCGSLSPWHAHFKVANPKWLSARENKKTAMPGLCNMCSFSNKEYWPLGTLESNTLECAQSQCMAVDTGHNTHVHFSPRRAQDSLLLIPHALASRQTLTSFQGKHTTQLDTSRQSWNRMGRHMQGTICRCWWQPPLFKYAVVILLKFCQNQYTGIDFTVYLLALQSFLWIKACTIRHNLLF